MHQWPSGRALDLRTHIPYLGFFNTELPNFEAITNYLIRDIIAYAVLVICSVGYDISKLYRDTDT